MSECTETLKHLQPSTFDIDAAAAALDAMEHSTRLATIRELDKKAQRNLFRECKGRAVGIEAIVPTDQPDFTEVIHHGKNSLPVFSHFQKRFARNPDNPDELLGYNHQVLAWLTGPGYFVAYAADGEVAIDYTRTPQSTLDSWPAIQPNERGVSNLVYAHMIDYLRAVSAHVTIGRAFRKGKWTENYFLLCRE
jgi:hypothetical protein